MVEVGFGCDGREDDGDDDGVGEPGVDEPGIDEPGVEAGGLDDDATVDLGADEAVGADDAVADEPEDPVVAAASAVSVESGDSVGGWCKFVDRSAPVDCSVDTEPDDTELTAAADVLGAGPAPASFGEQATRTAVTSNPETRAQIRCVCRTAPARPESERLCGVPLCMVSPETSSTRCFGHC